MTGQGNRTGLMIDALGGGDVQLAFCFKGAGIAILTGIPKRQARAIALRILHEIDFAEGKRARRPGNPHIGYEDRVLHEEWIKHYSLDKMFLSSPEKP